MNNEEQLARLSFLKKEKNEIIRDIVKAIDEVITGLECSRKKYIY